MPANVALDLVPADQLPIVRNLIRFYVYDMSEFMGWRCPDSGLFGGVDDLPKYWEQAGNAPFFIRVDGEMAGFSLIDGNPKEAGVDYKVGEFFVLRKFRGRGVGEQAAVQSFDRFRGAWHVEQLAKNTPAIAFWRKVIGRYTRGTFDESTTTSPWGPMNAIEFRNDEVERPRLPNIYPAACGGKPRESA
jgi:predicted acetyltransferase